MNLALFAAASFYGSAPEMLFRSVAADFWERYLQKNTMEFPMTL
jgi:hypothetical protein